MKDSGVEWIGEIPESWEISKVRKGFRANKMIAGEKAETLPRLSLGNAGVLERPKYDGFGESPADYATYQIIPKGQFVFNFMGLEQDLLYRRVGISPMTGLVSAGYMEANYIPSQINPDYAYYFFRFMESGLLFKQYGTGIRNNLNKQQFHSMPFLFPPLNEQIKISKVINQKVKKIDSIISETQQSIDELKKYKQALITETVTKGLDRSAEMKDSGIEWIGRISKTFHLPKLANVTSKIGSGKTPSGGENVYVPEGILFLRSQNIYDEGLEISSPRYISEEIDEQMSGTRVMQRDVLLNITGGSIGRSTVYTLSQPANVNQHVCIIRTRKDILLPEWLNLCLMSNIGKQSVLFFQTGGNREGLNFSDISKIRIPVPTLSVQKEIIDFLDIKIRYIQSLINQKEIIINAYDNYKNSLIYEYVTGKKEA